MNSSGTNNSSVTNGSDIAVIKLVLAFAIISSSKDYQY